MKWKTRLRLTSLLLLVIAAAFVLCALQAPTLGMPRRIGPISLTAAHWRAFYKLYACVIPLPFLISLFIRK